MICWMFQNYREVSEEIFKKTRKNIEYDKTHDFFEYDRRMTKLSNKCNTVRNNYVQNELCHLV